MNNRVVPGVMVRMTLEKRGPLFRRKLGEENPEKPKASEFVALIESPSLI